MVSPRGPGIFLQGLAVHGADGSALPGVLRALCPTNVNITSSVLPLGSLRCGSMPMCRGEVPAHPFQAELCHCLYAIYAGLAIHDLNKALLPGVLHVAGCAVWCQLLELVPVGLLRRQYLACMEGCPLEADSTLVWHVSHDLRLEGEAGPDEHACGLPAAWVQACFPDVER